jgi:hypothetical protein
MFSTMSAPTLRPMMHHGNTPEEAIPGFLNAVKDVASRIGKKHHEHGLLGLVEKDAAYRLINNDNPYEAVQHPEDPAGNAAQAVLTLHAKNVELFHDYGQCVTTLFDLIKNACPEYVITAATNGNPATLRTMTPRTLIDAIIVVFGEITESQIDAYRNELQQPLDPKAPAPMWELIARHMEAYSNLVAAGAAPSEFDRVRYFRNAVTNGDSAGLHFAAMQRYDHEHPVLATRTVAGLMDACKVSARNAAAVSTTSNIGYRSAAAVQPAPHPLPDPNRAFPWRTWKV